MLKRARISGFAASRSLPASLLASAPLYQKPGNVALGKSRKIAMEPAEPRTAEFVLHVRGTQVEAIVTVWLLVRVAPQIFAAAWKALRRCWPSVVPGLPPTGATTVGSLKPWPAGSLF